jgi:hypothetical protein
MCRPSSSGRSEPCVCGVERRVCQLLEEVAPVQRHVISGHGAVDFLPREAIDVLHQLFNIQVRPALRAQQDTAHPQRRWVVNRI